MVQRLSLMQRIADSADLPGEVAPGMPLVEIAGQCRVLIERHCGMTEYSRERICVSMSYGSVCIYGSELELSLMTQRQLVIAGIIDCVKILRRK